MHAPEPKIAMKPQRMARQTGVASVGAVAGWVVMSASDGGRGNDGDGAIGVMENRLADRADQHAGEAAPTAGAEDDQVRIGGEAEDVFGGVAGDLDQFGVMAAAGTDRVAEFGLGDPVQVAAGGLGGNDPDREVVATGVVDAEVECGLAGGRAVVPDDHSDAALGAE